MDHTKREQRRQDVIEWLRYIDDPDPEPAHCHCAKPAVFEVNRKSSVTFVCAEHVPEGL